MALRQLSNDVAKSLKHRIADLRAAGSIFEMAVGSPTIADDMDLIEIDLADQFKLVCRHGHVSAPADEEGRTDWHRVRRVQVLEIRR